jgi:hypothetical protein
MDENDKNKVEEPSSSYRKITISTLEEQSAEQIEYWASLTPEQRFNDFYELMNRFYDFSTRGTVRPEIIIDRRPPFY